MPLKTGVGNIRSNMEELMKGKIQSPARQKAISTIAKTRNVPLSEARFIQSRAISISQSRKK